MSEILPLFQSEYSIGRSILTCDKPSKIEGISPISIFSIAKENKLKEVFIKDSSFAGFIKARDSAEYSGINLRFGYQLILCSDIEDKSAESRLTESKVIIWLKNSEAYKAGIKISSLASTEGFYYYPRLSWVLLKELWDDNLILSIPMYDSFIQNNSLKMGQVVPDFDRIKPIFFIERLHELPFDQILVNLIEKYCDSTGYKYIYTHSINYYKESDFKYFSVFRCISNKSTLSKPEIDHFSSNRWSFETIEREKPSYQVEGFSDQFTKYDFPNFGWTKLPSPPILKEDRIKFGGLEDESNSKFLRRLAMDGFKQKLESGQIPKQDYQVYIDKCKFELDTFDELNFTDYILLVWKIIEKARELGVFIDYGRWSVVSSVVCWFLGLSGCDPITYKLFFSRFVSKSRAKSKIVNNEKWISLELAPDIDCNLGEGRSKIIEWLKEIYPNRVCKISNLSTLTGKMLVKDVYKTIEEVSEEEAKRVSDMIERRFGVVQDLEDVYSESEEFKNWADSHKDVYETCLAIRNLARQFSSHASGYIISSDELINHTPLMLDSEKQVMSAYTMDYAQALKVDLLGLSTNFVIKEILKNIPEKIEDVNLDNNPIIYDQFQNNDLLPYGLYQISSSCAYKVCNNLKPKNLLELSHVNAIARPTALAYEKDYLENRSECPHELFRAALEWTNFQPLYQEQTIMMVKAIGFSDEESENFRKVFAKKQLDKVDEWVEKVRNKIKENNLPEKAGDILIKLAQESANYQFSLAHSIATSTLSSLTVYLKYKYPLQFYLAWLKQVSGIIEDVTIIEKEMKKFGIKLLPPSIKKSGLDYSIEDGNIRMGLANIKSIANKTIEKVNEFRHEYINKFEIFESANQAKLPINALTVLIGVGALDDSFTQSRSWVILEANLWNLLTDKEKLIAHKLGPDYNFDLLKIIPAMNKDHKNEKGKPYIKDSRLETIKKRYAPYKEIYKQNSKNQDFADWFYAARFLGFTYGKTLKDIFIKKRPGLININEVKKCPDQQKDVAFVGQVVEYKKGISKNKNPYVRFIVADETDNCTVFLFNDKIKNCEELNGDKLPEKEDFVIVRGMKKGDDAVFAEIVAVQSNDIFVSVSQVKDKDGDKEFIMESNIVFPIKKEMDVEENS